MFWVKVFLILFLSYSPGWSKDSIKAGWAKVDLTPPFSSFPLAGFGQRGSAKAEGMLDPIYARALILEGEKEKIAVVSVDLVLVTRTLREEVERRLLPHRLSALLLSATHNHSGVGGYWDDFWAERFGMGKYDERIFTFLAKRISQAVKEADKRKFQARVGAGEVTVQGLNRNRRINPGPVDTQLLVVRIDDQEGQPRIAIVNFAAHATVLGPRNMLLSTDYPGALTTGLEEKLALAVFTAGPSGDLGPRPPKRKDRYDRVKAMGLALARNAEGLLQEIKTESVVSLRSQTREIPLPKATLRTRVPFGLHLLADPFFRLFAPSAALLQVIRINGVVLSALPVELGVEIGLDLKSVVRREMGYEHLMVVTLANDYIGYALTEKDYWRGGYETSMSFFGPRLGEYLKGQMLGLIEALT